MQQHGAGVQQIAVGEAFKLAEKLGLSDQALYDVITGATGNCWAVQTNCPVPGPVPTRRPTTKPPATALMNKDLGLAMDAVTSTGARPRPVRMPRSCTGRSPNSIRIWISRQSSRRFARGSPRRFC